MIDDKVCMYYGTLHHKVMTRVGLHKRAVFMPNYACMPEEMYMECETPVS